MKFLNSHIFILMLVLLGQYTFGQNTSITVSDKRTTNPISYANVVLFNPDKSLHKGLTSDRNGVANFTINNEVTYTISFMGYADKSGTIKPGDNLSIELKVDTEILDAVVVTGQYKAKRADKSIYKIDVVNSQQLQERGVSNLAEALSNETNIRIKSDPSTGTSIEMQGMGGENVKYLIDGIPIVGRVDGNIDLSQINMDNVDHIEIVQGPMSVVYGTSALAGVINIITKQNTIDRNNFKANTYIDNKNNYNVGLYGSLIRGKNTFTLSGQRNMFQGIDIDLNVEDKSGKDRNMEFKPKLVYNADAEYTYRVNDFSLKVKSSFMNTELRNYTNPNPMMIAGDGYLFTTRFTNSITSSDKISETLHYNIIGSHTYYDRTADLYFKDLSTLEEKKIGSVNTTFQNLMTRGNFTFIPIESEISYQFGWDINHDTGIGDKISNENGEQMTDYAAFASAQWAPLDNLSIQPGVRFIYNTSYGAPVIPSINVQYEIINNLNFRISYAKGFRAPSLKELYLDFVDINHNLQGNDSLKAETTNSYNTSLSYKFEQDNYFFKITPSFFFNDGKDKIVLIVTDPETNSATNTNFGAARTIGFNINATFLHYNGLTLGAGYSRTGESYSYEGRDSFTDYIFYDNYTFNAKYNFNKLKLVLMANYKLYGETPSLMADPDIEDSYYNIFTKAYSDLELTVSKMFFKNRLSVVVGGKNLFDNYYSTTYGYKTDEPERYGAQNYGRTFFIRINLKLRN